MALLRVNGSSPSSQTRQKLQARFPNHVHQKNRSTLTKDTAILKTDAGCTFCEKSPAKTPKTFRSAIQRYANPFKIQAACL